MSQRKVILTSKLESIALYGAQLASNETESQRKRLEGILMRINKWIFGHSTFKMNYKKLCNDIKVEPPDQKVLKINKQYIAKIFYQKEVDQILEMLKINARLGSKVYFKNPVKATSKALLARHVCLYNALPLDLKILNPPRLKRKLKKLTVSFKD